MHSPLLPLMVLLSAVHSAPDGESRGSVVRSKHFVIRSAVGIELAGRVAGAAERLYEDLASDLSFTRHDNFWLWDDRVKIYLHATRHEFVAATGAPEWAEGKADYGSREVHGFASDSAFVERVLPHELAHLMFREFVGFGRAVPLWLDEGVAQWAERGRRPETEALVRRLDTRGELLPLAALARLNVREAADPLVAARFYGQAASVVGYLIVAHGAGRFRKLCGHLRAGKSIDDALRFTYPSTARNMVTLEQQWKAHLREAR